MELPLLVSKIALQRMRSPNAEILDILSARPVEHHIEAMERLNIGNEFYPLLTGDGVLSENLPDQAASKSVPMNIRSCICLLRPIRLCQPRRNCRPASIVFWNRTQLMTE